MQKNKKIEKLIPFISIIIILIAWQIIINFKIIPKFMLPSPIDVVKAFIKDFFVLMEHTKITLLEAFLGFLIGMILSFIIAIIMDSNKFLYKSIYPILIITQTIPTVAIAPLLVLWLGYGILPKIVLVVLTSFFPITIGLLDGFSSVDKDMLNLMKTMNASKWKIFYHIKLPSSIRYFFSGVRIAISYSVIGAVVAEWIGGFGGLGVYMTRVRKSYSFDKMFAVIFFISILSLVLMYLVKKIEKALMPWDKKGDNYGNE